MSEVWVYRGRRASRATDRAATGAMVAAAGRREAPAVRVWQPGQQLAFGRRDTRRDGYEAARAAASAHEFPPVERSVGGRAVAYAETTLAVAHAVPVSDGRRGLDDRYEAALERLLQALRSVGASVTRGEPPEAYCPGDYSIRTPDGGKLAGIAQRVRDDAALVAAVVTVADRRSISAVLTDVYDALGVTFDPASVGSVRAAGGPAEPTPVRRALEAELVGDHTVRLCDVTALEPE